MKTEDRILAVAGELLEKLGPDGLTTRAVGDAAGISPPTLYHHFGDKNGLIRALVARGVQDFLDRKQTNVPTSDAEADLKRGWDIWLNFAEERPTLFRLMALHAAANPETMQKSYQLMRQTLQRLEEDGRLQTDLNSASRAVWAASSGVLQAFLQGVPLDEVRQTSDLLFAAVKGKVIGP